MSENITTILNDLISSRLAEVHTSFPGEITRVNNDGSVNVKPLFVQGERFPEIPNLALSFPQTRTTGLQFKVVAGDFCTVLVSERSLDEWLSGDGEEVETDSDERFSLVDAIAIPGILPFSQQNILPEDVGLSLRHGENSIIIKDNGDIKIGGGNLRKLVTESFQSKYNEHTHTDSVGGTTTSPVVGAMLPADLTNTEAV